VEIGFEALGGKVRRPQAENRREKDQKDFFPKPVHQNLTVGTAKIRNSWQKLRL